MSETAAGAPTSPSTTGHRSALESESAAAELSPLLNDSLEDSCSLLCLLMLISSLYKDFSFR